MGGSLIVRATRVIFIVCLLLVLFTVRLVWKKTNNRTTADGHLLQGTQKSTSLKTSFNSRIRPLTRNDQVGFLHLIIQFPLILNGSDSLQLQQRRFEYIQALQKNLDHPLIRKVHILCEDDKVIEFIEKQFILYSEKMVLKNIGRRMLYSDALAYISKRLLLKTCIIMNADCYIGNGFGYLDTDILQRGTIYALTRHEDARQVISCGVKDLCGVNAKYIGSHDAFVMNLVQPIPDAVLHRLHYRPNIVGVENVVIFVLKRHGHFRLKNPCHTLYIIHNHCNKKRGDRRMYRQRLEKYLKLPKGLAYFSGL